MSSLLDKLTGKAPLREDPVDANKAADGAAENEADGKGKDSPKFGLNKKPKGPVASNMTERKTDYSYLLVILKWMIPMGVCLLLIIGATFTDSVMNSGLRSQISQQVVDHENLQNKINAKQAELDAKIADAEREANSGKILVSDKHIEDDAAAEKFFSRYLTWSSSKEYNELRGEFKAIYASSPQFVEVLFPEEWFCVDPVTYEQINYIDYEHMNLKFDRIESYRLGLGEDRVSPSYVAVITASRTNPNGSISTVLFYTEYDIVQTAGEDGSVVRGMNLKRIVPLVEREDY